MKNDDTDSTLAHKVFRRVSSDGGVTYGAAEAVLFKPEGHDPVPLQCVLRDRGQDTRAGSVMLMVVEMDDSIRILESRTKGHDWKQRLSM